MNRYHKIMERFWLLTFIGMSGLVFYLWYIGEAHDPMLFAMPFAALLMYALRKFAIKKNKQVNS